MSGHFDGWVGVDLDGTLATYNTWEGPEHIGEPIPEMVERVKAWRRDGRAVRIFTARVFAPADDAVRQMDAAIMPCDPTPLIAVCLGVRSRDGWLDAAVCTPKS
jgi:hypothetical protein